MPNAGADIARPAATEKSESVPSTADRPGATDFGHQAVMVEEVLALAPDQTRFIADGTIGGGGHAEALLGQFPEADLFGCDRDGAAVAAARDRLAAYGERVLVKHLPFAELPHYVVLGTVDYLLLDLGVSSHQLDEPGRGFSFTREGPLDMRMDPSGGGPTAADMVNGADAEELREVLYRWGEERFTPRIVRAIVDARAAGPIRTTSDLARIVAGAVPARFHRKGHHPATKSFQALRIAVNGELDQLTAVLAGAPSLLARGGRIAVISFHSLEDRTVKETFRGWEHPCRCPPEMPRCICGRVALGRRVTRKPVTAGPEETAANPRCRSAKLRAFEMAPQGAEIGRQGAKMGRQDSGVEVA